MSPSTQKSSALYNYNLMTSEIWTVWNIKFVEREKERGLSLRASCPFRHRSEVKIETREKTNSWRWGVLYTDLPLYPTINLKQSFELWGVQQTGGYIVSWFPCRRGHGDPASFKLRFSLRKLGWRLTRFQPRMTEFFSFIFSFLFLPHSSLLALAEQISRQQQRCRRPHSEHQSCPFWRCKKNKKGPRKDLSEFCLKCFRYNLLFKGSDRFLQTILRPFK